MRTRCLLLCLLTSLLGMALPRERYNFNSRWLLHVGDVEEASLEKFDDRDWQAVSLPHAFNEDEAFRLDIHDLTDTVVVSQALRRTSFRQAQKGVPGV